MAQIVVQEVSLVGVTCNFVAADVNGDYFVNDGSTLFVLVNNDIVDKTATIVSIQKCNQGHLHDISVVIPAGHNMIIGPFSRNRFNTDAKEINVIYSDVVNLLIGAIKLPA